MITNGILRIRTCFSGLVTNIGHFWEVRLALLALSLVLALAQAVVNNAHNTSLTPLTHQL